MHQKLTDCYHEHKFHCGDSDKNEMDDKVAPTLGNYVTFFFRKD